MGVEKNGLVSIGKVLASMYKPLPRNLVIEYLCIYNARNDSLGHGKLSLRMR